MKQTRNTAAKELILETLRVNEEALSRAELIELVEHQCDRVTVYRVLDRLLEEGYVHNVGLPDGTVKYALCHDCDLKHHRHDHAHFSCLECGTVTCLSVDIPHLSLPKGYKPAGRTLVISGRCAKCA